MARTLTPTPIVIASSSAALTAAGGIGVSILFPAGMPRATCAPADRDAIRRAHDRGQD